MALLGILSTGTCFVVLQHPLEFPAPSGCPTGSGPIPWPLSCGSEDTTAASAVDTTPVPHSFQLLASPWYPATSSTFTGMWVPSHSTHTFSCWTDVSFQQYLPLQDLCHLPSNISCSPGSDAHSSWALLKTQPGQQGTAAAHVATRAA